MLQLITTEEAKQRSLAADLERITAAFSWDATQQPETSSQEALMDHVPDSRASSPLLGEPVGSSPENLPMLHGRGSGESNVFNPDVFGTCLPSDGSRRRRRTSRSLRRPVPGTKQQTMDFGFRQDGEGEESLENWTLFKVTKSPDQKVPRRGAGGGRRLPRAAFPRELRICNSEPKLRGNSKDFSEYITRFGFDKPDTFDSHALSSVLRTNRHRHSLPVIAGVASLAS